jgi:hypothetical protein
VRDALCFFYQVGYFLSPFDFLSDLLTFFLLRAAFKRFAFPLFLIRTSRFLESRRWKVESGFPATLRFQGLQPPSTFHLPPASYLTNQMPITMRAVPTTLESVTSSLSIKTLRRAVTKG